MDFIRLPGRRKSKTYLISLKERGTIDDRYLRTKDDLLPFVYRPSSNERGEEDS